MHSSAKTRLIKIGNSQGVRIPKLLIEQVGLEGDLEIAAEPGQIVIRVARLPRFNWDEQFASMAAAGDDLLLDGETLTLTNWDANEWVW